MHRLLTLLLSKVPGRLLLQQACSVWRRLLPQDFGGRVIKRSQEGLHEDWEDEFRNEHTSKEDGAEPVRKKVVSGWRAKEVAKEGTHIFASFAGRRGTGLLEMR